MTQARSARTWGKRKELTEQELEAECAKFFGRLVVPPEWKFKGFDRAPDKSTGVDVISVGAIYLDKRTSGYNIKHYRVWLNLYSLNGGIVEKKLVEVGNRMKEVKTCVVMNKPVEMLNEYIYENYHRLEQTHKYWKLPRRIIRKRWKRNWQ
jgi:hypothetical protein